MLVPHDRIYEASWLMGCFLACGDQLIMALSYTQKTSDNSLITKYVREITVLLSSYLILMRSVRTAIPVRPIRHLPCAGRIVHGEPVFR